MKQQSELLFQITATRDLRSAQFELVPSEEYSKKRLLLLRRALANLR